MNKKKIYEERHFNMYNEDGTLKDKDEILDAISEIYDEMAESKKGETHECDCLTTPVSADEILEEFAFDERSLYIYDEITSEYVHGAINAIKFWNTIDEEEGFDYEDRQPIKIYINTPGGELDATLTIIDAIKLSKTPVYTISVGKSWSGGFFIAVNGHKRIGFPNSSYLFHEGSTMWGSDAHKVIQYTDFYKKQLNRLKKLTLKNTSITDSDYDEHKKDDWWFNAEEALKYGIIDEIATELI